MINDKNNIIETKEEKKAWDDWNRKLYLGQVRQSLINEGLEVNEETINRYNKQYDLMRNFYKNFNI